MAKGEENREKREREGGNREEERERGRGAREEIRRQDSRIFGKRYSGEIFLLRDSLRNTTQSASMCTTYNKMPTISATLTFSKFVAILLS